MSSGQSGQSKGVKFLIIYKGFTPLDCSEATRKGYPPDPKKPPKQVSLTPPGVVGGSGGVWRNPIPQALKSVNPIPRPPKAQFCPQADLTGSWEDKFYLLWDVFAYVKPQNFLACSGLLLLSSPILITEATPWYGSIVAWCALYKANKRPPNGRSSRFPQ